MSVLRQWIFAMAGAALICAAAGRLTPKGPVKRVQKLLCSVVMTLALVSPLTGLDLSAYSINLARYRSQQEEIINSSRDISDSLSRTIIAGDLEAYILDKALELGCSVSEARVSLSWNADGFWYPSGVRLEGEFDGRLSAVIESQLGIGRKEQRWSGDEDGRS